MKFKLKSQADPHKLTARPVSGLAAAMLAVATSVSVPVLAQDEVQESAQDNNVVQLDETVVTGIRGSLNDALDKKQNSSSIIDAINAEDIGKFPDQNIAESLSRVTGVTITRDFGEGEQVSIRGTQTSQNRTLLNGASVASTDWFTLNLPSRGFNFLILPSNLVKGLEVYKSPQANIQEGSLGGTVYLNTRRPLELGQHEISAQLEVQDSDNSEESDPLASVLYSYKNDAETFGFLISATSQERTVNRFGREVITFLPPDSNQSDFWLPRLIGEVDFRQERERETFFASFEWAPNDRLSAVLNILDTTFDANNTNHNNLATLGADNAQIIESSIVTAGTGVEEGVVAATFDATNTVVGGNAGARQQIFDRISSIETDSFDFEIGYAGDVWDFTGRIGTTDSEGGAPDQRFYSFTSEGNNSIAPIDTLTFDQNLNLQFLTASGLPETDAEYLDRPLEFADQRSTINFEEEDYAGFDLAKEVDSGGFTLFQFGALFRDRETSREASRTRFDWWGDDDHLVVDLDNGMWGQIANLRPEASRFLNRPFRISPTEVVGDNGAFFGAVTVAELALDGASANQDQPISFFSTGQRGRDFFLINPDLARSISTPASQDDVITIPTLNDTWSVAEETLAAYVKGEFDTGLISGDIGMRVIRTEVDSTGFVIQGNAEGAAALLTPNATLVASAFGCSTTNICSATQTTVSSSYTEFLPNINISYDLSDEVKLRFAAARTISRPNPEAIALRENFFINTLSGTRGNPDLEPISANQFDFSAEWYFAQGALLSGTYFYKDIRGNLLSSLSSEVRIDAETLTPVTIEFSTPINGQDATVQGLEFSYQQPIGENFGIIVNATFTDADSDQQRDPIGAPGSGVVANTSDETFNITGYYENNWFDARLSYNFRSEFLNETAFFGSEIWTDDFAQVDFSSSFSITDYAQITFDVINLTDEDTDQFHLIPSRASKLYDNDQRIILGLNLNFN